MKRKELVVVNAIIAALLVGFGLLAINLSLNHDPTAGSPTAQAASGGQSNSQHCSTHKPLTIPADTSDPGLKRLQDYQNLCQSFVTNKLMLFTTFSQDQAAADANAAAMAARLKALHSANITPLVIIEPYLQDQAMSYKSYLAGAYDAGMEQYFAKLKSLGVTDQMMGTWVPFPESNTPSWNNKDTEPADFALCVNKYLGTLKKYFPGAKGSILLSATTYLPTDANWENGDYLSLAPYVDKIDRNLVTSFGIQGFPWMSNAQQSRRTIFKASEFLQPNLAIGAAQILRTRDIWINTGTFASKYTKDSKLTVHMTSSERKGMLSDILDVAKNIRNYQENQYRVSINLFAQDKSDAFEATDWSYMQSVESQGILRGFLAQANDLGFPISLFDEAAWKLQ